MSGQSVARRHIELKYQNISPPYCTGYVCEAVKMRLSVFLTLSSQSRITVDEPIFDKDCLIHGRKALCKNTVLSRRTRHLDRFYVMVIFIEVG